MGLGRWFRTRVSLAQDLDLIPRTGMTAHTKSMTPFLEMWCLPLTPCAPSMREVHMQKCRQKILLTR